MAPKACSKTARGSSSSWANPPFPTGSGQGSLPQTKFSNEKALTFESRMRHSFGSSASDGRSHAK